MTLHIGHVMDVLPTLEPESVQCVLCESLCDGSRYVSMYEGEVVDPSETDEWAGFPICERCDDWWNVGIQPAKTKQGDRGD